MESKSGRDTLLELQSQDTYVFHGAEDGDFKMLEPRQAYTFENGQKKEDDKPAIHASAFADIAILMRLLTGRTVLRDLRADLGMMKS